MILSCPAPEAGPTSSSPWRWPRAARWARSAGGWGYNPASTTCSGATSGVSGWTPRTCPVRALPRRAARDASAMRTSSRRYASRRRCTGSCDVWVTRPTAGCSATSSPTSAGSTSTPATSAGRAGHGDWSGRPPASPLSTSFWSRAPQQDRARFDRGSSPRGCCPIAARSADW